jgi:hypothetical protein
VGEFAAVVPGATAWFIPEGREEGVILVPRRGSARGAVIPEILKDKADRIVKGRSLAGTLAGVVV